MDADYDLFMIQPDGTGLTNLTPGMPGDQIGPTIDPTGRRIVFRTDEPAPGDDRDLWIVNSDGTGATPLVTGPTDDFYPSFSPDGRQIAFSRDTTPDPALFGDLMVVNADGTGLRNLTNTAGRSERDPAYSPDGRLIYFSARESVPSDDVNSMSAGGGAASPVILGPTDDSDAVPSPDGRRLAFTREDVDQLFVADANGQNPVNITPTWASEAYNASWSPTGKRLVWDDDSTNLYIVGAGGGAITPLTDDGQSDLTPAWEYVYKCAGKRATIVGDAGPDKIKGTKKADVIVANAGKDKIRGRGGNDRICGGAGKDKLIGGSGKDRLFGQQGRDGLVGGKGEDRLRGGKGRDSERQ